jgi:hypothetical protein
MTVGCNFQNCKKMLQSPEITFMENNTVVLFNNEVEAVCVLCCWDYRATFCVSPICSGPFRPLSMSFSVIQMDVSEV